MNTTLSVVRIDILLSLLRETYEAQYRALAGLSLGDPADFAGAISALEAEFARLVETAQATPDVATEVGGMQ